MDDRPTIASRHLLARSFLLLCGVLLCACEAGTPTFEDLLGKEQEEGARQTQSWSFENTNDYTYDTAHVDLSAQNVKLNLIYHDDDTDTDSGFQLGSHSGTEFSPGVGLGLSSAGVSNLEGQFTSRVFDAGDAISWSSFSWQPWRPYAKDLPDNQFIESAYPSGNVDMTDNLVLYHLNENAVDTTLIADSSGNGHDANLSIAEGGSKTVPSVLNKGIDFDGINDQILTPTKVTATFTEFSMSIWFRSFDGSPSGSRLIMDWGNSSPVGYYRMFVVHNVGGDTIELFSNNNYAHCYVPAGYFDDQWHHLVFTGSANGRKGYVDGVQVCSAAPIGPATMDGFVGIGGSWSGGSHFSGQLDEAAIWTRELSATEVQDIYRRGAEKIEFQVRSCADTACNGDNFIGPDGTANTWFSELHNTNPGLPAFNISGLLTDNRYFQYRMLSYTYSGNALGTTRVDIGPAHYSPARPDVVNNMGVSFSSLHSFSETLGALNQGSTSYQISHNGNDWYYHNGNQWTLASVNAESNGADSVSANIESFMSDVGISAGEFYFKAFLLSDGGTQSVELDSVNLEYTSPVPFH